VASPPTPDDRAPRILHLDDVERIAVAGVEFRPVRRTLGVTAFGINAFSGDAGQRVIEEHDETGAGAGSHEELYLVTAGAAAFELDGREVEVGPGGMVFIPDLATRRGAVATADGTTVVVLGGRSGAALPASPFEHWFVAEPAYAAGRYREAEAIVRAGLAEHPGHPTMQYQLACYVALDGRPDEALALLQAALDGDPSLARYARTDADLASLRGLADWPL
jgi:quercetin dioxygenase-like cupin family protein